MTTMLEIMMAGCLVSGLSRSAIRAGAGSKTTAGLVGVSTRNAIARVARSHGVALNTIGRAISRDHTTALHGARVEDAEADRMAREIEAVLASPEWPRIARLAFADLSDARQRYVFPARVTRRPVVNFARFSTTVSGGIGGG